MKKYFTIGETASQLGVTPQTLRNWDKKNILKPHHTGAGGHRYYTQQQIDQKLGMSLPEPTTQRLHIGYVRVSTRKQLSALENQKTLLSQYLTAKGRSYTFITDIGSGLNYTKPGLSQLVTLILSNKVETITVTHHDRLLRFGAPLLEQICSHYNTTIEYIETPLEDDTDNIAQTVLEVLTVYSTKLNGKRGKKAKELVKELQSHD